MNEPINEPILESSADTDIEPTREVSAFITQSRYFNPAFNAAIFDGPIRIYFAQFQEAQALKLYFNLQERFGDVRRQVRGLFKDRGGNIFVMLYPSAETFGASFANAIAKDVATNEAERSLVSERWGVDFVIGVSGPLQDEALEAICHEMDSLVRAPSA